MLLCGPGYDFANGGRGTDSASTDCEATVNTTIAPPPGMVSWWPADGHPQDIMDCNDGMLMNGATYAGGMVGPGIQLGRSG